MIPTEGVIVSNSATRFRSVLIILQHVVCQVCKLSKVLLDVEYVGVQVEVLVSVGVYFDELLEPINGDVVLLRLVAPMGNLVTEVDRVRKVPQQGS